MPLWGSMPRGPLVWSWGTGHTAGALSAHVTWQEKLHTRGAGEGEDMRTQHRFQVVKALYTGSVEQAGVRWNTRSKNTR